MRLKQFQVTDFRSIIDSGIIQTDKLTTLVGRNESGKSNLLLALSKMNPSSEERELTPDRDFPKSKNIDECSDATPFLKTWWKLDEEDRRDVEKMSDGFRNLQTVRLTSYYDGDRIAHPDGIPWPIVEAEFSSLLRSTTAKIAATISTVAPNGPSLRRLVNEINNADRVTASWKAWEVAVRSALEKLVAIAATHIPFSGSEYESDVLTLRSQLDSVAEFTDAREALGKWTIEKLPTTVYVEDYPTLLGRHNLAEYSSRKASSALEPGDVALERICRLGGFSPEQLYNLDQQGRRDRRTQIANHAGAKVTESINRLWKDRVLKVRFYPDGPHLSLLISDPIKVGELSSYDLEINLDERSKGFRWFFSFYATYAAEANERSRSLLLLLDEPGLHLHAASQNDLIRHLRDDLPDQIIYSTHSPFMIPPENLDLVRTVHFEPSAGTTVTNDPRGDARTLFPLQAALGYHLAQSLFIGPNNLLVEGITDLWILSAVSAYCRDHKLASLPRELTITPGDGAQKIQYLAALLSAERLNVLVLLDSEKEAHEAARRMIEAKLIRAKGIIHTNEAFTAQDHRVETDIEDLLGEPLYGELIKECYKDELEGIKLDINNNLPRIVQRYEAAFSAHNLRFNKSRPARRFMQLMGQAPETVMKEEVLLRFEKLFTIIGERLEAQQAARREPFA